MLTLRHQRGVSMIEIAIGLAIVGIGIAWAIPSYSVWMQNLQIRTMTESIVAGLQLARSEAISRNGRAEFILTNQDPSAAIAQTALDSLTDETGTSWMVRAFLPPGSATTYGYVTGRTGAEGSANATVLSGDAGFAGGLAAITFDGFGRLSRDGNGVLMNADGSAPIAKLCVKSNKLDSAHGARNLEINIGASGLVKMCDPVVTDATDPRRCLTPAPRCS
ncbi:MAG: GspH/FimT family pseudopilin [Burkholderiales bacterium]